MKRIIAVVLTLILTACATGPNGQPFSKEESTAVNAGIGCAMGAVLAKVTGARATEGCVAGGVIGGIAGYVTAREKELADAKQTAAEVPRARLETQKVSVSDQSTGERKSVDSFKAMSVPMNPRYALNSSDGRDTLLKLGQLAAKYKSSVTLAGGTSNDREQAAAILRSGGALDIHADNTIHTSAYAAKPTDLLVILQAADRRQSVNL